MARWQERNAMPWDLLDPRIPRVSEDVYIRRWSLCQSCEHLREKTKTCTECNCFMKTKCALPNAFCPIGKWDAEEVSEEKV